MTSHCSFKSHCLTSPLEVIFQWRKEALKAGTSLKGTRHVEGFKFRGFFELLFQAFLLFQKISNTPSYHGKSRSFCIHIMAFLLWNPKKLLHSPGNQHHISFHRKDDLRAYPFGGFHVSIPWMVQPSLIRPGVHKPWLIQLRNGDPSRRQQIAWIPY